MENTAGLIKNKIINTILILYSLVSVPLLVLSVYRVELTGWIPIYFVQIFLLSTFWLLYAFRNKFSYKFKAIYAVITLFILASTGIYFFVLLLFGIILFLSVCCFFKFVYRQKVCLHSVMYCFCCICNIRNLIY